MAIVRCVPLTPSQETAKMTRPNVVDMQGKKIKPKVIELPCTTRLDLPPDRLLRKALKKLESVVILGYDKEGFEYFASSKADGAEVLWLLERCKHTLMSFIDGDEDD
jgi:hypothetical protein